MRRLKNLSGFVISALIFSLFLSLFATTALVLTPQANAATILCVKGKNVLKVSGSKPICPAGYKKQTIKATPSPKATAQPTATPKATPTPTKIIAPVDGIGVEVPYMELQVGCYSSTYPVSGPVSIQKTFIDRKFYTASCTGQFHWQVFYAGQIKTLSMFDSMLDSEATPFCYEEYKRKFGKDAPTEIAPNAIYLRWLFSDTAELGKLYPRRMICMVHTADAIYQNALVNTKPLG